MTHQCLAKNDWTQRSPAPLAGRSLLVVEDEAIVAFLIEDMLKQLGADDVRHAPNVARALALIEAHRPDAALLDVNLGRELVYPVAACLEAQSIPFVFVTGYGRRGLAPEWAARDVLQKPFDPHMLREALCDVLNRRR